MAVTEVSYTAGLGQPDSAGPFDFVNVQVGDILLVLVGSNLNNGPTYSSSSDDGATWIEVNQSSGSMRSRYAGYCIALSSGTVRVTVVASHSQNARTFLGHYRTDGTPVVTVGQGPVDSGTSHVTFPDGIEASSQTAIAAMGIVTNGTMGTLSSDDGWELLQAPGTNKAAFFRGFGVGPATLTGDWSITTSRSGAGSLVVIDDSDDVAKRNLGRETIISCPTWGGSTDDVVFDHSGNDNFGTNTAGELVDLGGKGGTKAWKFDRALNSSINWGSHIETTDNAATFAGWVCFHDLSANWNFVFGQASTALTDGCGLYVQADGSLFAWSGNYSGNQIALPAGTIEQDRWYHFTFVMDAADAATNPDLHLYIDGQLAVTSATKGRAFDAHAWSSRDLTLASAGGSTVYDASVYIDDFRFYKNQALDVATIGFLATVRGKELPEGLGDEGGWYSAQHANHSSGLIDLAGSEYTALPSSTKEAYPGENTTWQGEEGLFFDGVTDTTYTQVVVPDDPSFSTDIEATDFAVSLWFNTSYETTQSTHLLRHCDTADRDGWTLLFTTSERVKFSWGPDNAGKSTQTATSGLDDGTWHHVCAVLSRSRGVTEIYLDGVLDGTTTDHHDHTTNATDLYIGWQASQGDYAYNGYMDDMRLFPHDMTATDVALLARDRKQPPRGTETFHYHPSRDPNAGSDTLTDLSGNGHHGAISGTAFSTDLSVKNDFLALKPVTDKSLDVAIGNPWCAATEGDNWSISVWAHVPVQASARKIGFLGKYWTNTSGLKIQLDDRFMKATARASDNTNVVSFPFEEPQDGSGDFDNDTLQHFVLTKEYDGVMRFYRNGVSVLGTAAYPSTIPNVSWGDSLTLGDDGGSNSQDSVYYVDDWRSYPRVLSHEEIKWLGTAPGVEGKPKKAGVEYDKELLYSLPNDPAGGSGTAITDLSGNGYDGVITPANGDWATDVDSNNVLEIQTITAWSVDVTDPNDDLQVREPVTYSMWYKGDPTAHTKHLLDDGRNSLSINSGDLLVAESDWTTGDWDANTSVGSVPDGWNHYAMSFLGEAGNGWQFWINGSPVATNNFSDGSDDSKTISTLRVFKSGILGEQFASVRRWQRNLEDAEIAEVYAGGRTYIGDGPKPQCLKGPQLLITPDSVEIDFGAWDSTYGDTITYKWELLTWDYHLVVDSGTTTDRKITLTGEFSGWYYLRVAGWDKAGYDYTQTQESDPAEAKVNGLGNEALWINTNLDTVGNGTLITYDQSQMGNDGTLDGMDVADWVVDGDDTVLTFDGVDDYVQQTLHSTDLKNKSFTLSGWCEPTSVSGSEALTGANSSLTIRRNGVYLESILNGLSTVTHTGTVASFAAGEWAHWAVIFDSEAGTVTHYINGDQTDQWTGITGSLVTNTYPLGIGAVHGI